MARALAAGVTLCVMLLPELACGQAKSPRAMTRFVDAETGVTLTYPAAWKKSLYAGYGGDPLQQYNGKDGHSLARMRLMVGWDLYTQDENGETHASSGSFGFAVLPERSAAACAARFAEFAESGSEAGKPASRVIGGVKYSVQEYSDAGLGHSWGYTLYTTFWRGRCLGFSTGGETSRIDETFKSSRWDKQVPSDPEIIMRSVRLR